MINEKTKKVLEKMPWKVRFQDKDKKKGVLKEWHIKKNIVMLPLCFGRIFLSQLACKHLLLIP